MAISYLDWSDAVKQVEPHVVRIMTPEGSGSGFLTSVSADGETIAIATAAHVVNHAHYWEQPLRIEHKSSGKTVLLRSADRAIFPDSTKDTAAIVFRKGELPFPANPLGLSPEGKFLLVGNEIGWLGFPAVAPGDLCFFTGRVSHYRQNSKEYLVDGVAINGVSGGPAFWNGGDKVTLMGVMAAYIANRATGETLPGIAVVSDIEQLHELSMVFKSVDDAKKKEPPPEPPSAKPETPNPALNQMRKQPRAG